MQGTEARLHGDHADFPHDFDTGLCWGTFAAIQGLIVYAQTGPVPIHRVCAPPESMRTQLISIFVEYARRNPKHHHENAADVALDALREAFLCADK
jgi:hypothetical protein